MSYIYLVFEHLKQLWMGIWQHTHTVATTEVSLDWTQLQRAPIKFDNDKVITATSGPVVVMSLRHIGARGALDVTRVPY
jgi:hypothetical protein